MDSYLLHLRSIFNQFLYNLRATFCTKFSFTELCVFYFWMIIKFRQIRKHVLCYHLFNQLITNVPTSDYFS
jgi:hypothetical protein